MTLDPFIEGSATLRIELESPELAKTILEALQPETTSSPTDRATASLRVEDCVLVIEINASDLTALRAAMNSYLAWVSASKRLSESLVS